MASGLEAQGIPTAENLLADVEGDIEDQNGVLKITTIRLTYRCRIPKGTREKAEVVLAGYAERCPAYQSIKGCIQCTWRDEITED